MIFDVSTTVDIDDALARIKANAAHTCVVLRTLPVDPVKALAQLKFAEVGSHPLERRPLNVVEQLNQTFTYLVALKAARLLLQWHPEAEGFRLAPGAHAPRGSLDIESHERGLVGAETFAAVPRPCGLPRTGWSRGSTAGSRTYCRATASTAARSWSRPSCATSASTTPSSRKLPSRAE